MNFTLFLNSRGREGQLNRFIESVEKTACVPNYIEMIITVDNDDIGSVNFVKNLQLRKSLLNFKPIIGDRPKSLCASYNNMARQARGKYLFVMNDDVEIQTKNWDKIAWDKIEEFKKKNNFQDDIIYGMTSDTSIDKPAGKTYASFPIISKKAVDVLGFFMYEEFVGLGGDSSIIKIYEQVNRIVDMQEIVVDHVYHNTIFKVMAPDQTAHEMRANSHQNNIDPFAFDVSKDVANLQHYINNTNYAKISSDIL